MIPIDLSGRTAIVTGATGELGRAMVRTLADAEADVAVHYLNNREMADTLVEELKGMGRRAVAVRADVTDRDSVSRMAATVRSALGDPDIVVDNAVIQYELTTVLEQRLEDYEIGRASGWERV